MANARVLLVFIDGVGLGAAASYNPFMEARLPTLHQLLGVRAIIAASARVHGPAASLVALDATLGAAGTPQSGTGQTTLFTGINAASLHGRHFGPWVPAALRPMLRRQNILSRAAAAGRTIAFANAYPEHLIRLASEAAADTRLPAFLRAGPPVAAVGAGVLTRTAADIQRGNAVTSEIVNDSWRDMLGYTDLPHISARTAGTILAGIAAQHDLTLFAHYATDTAGHTGDMSSAVAALERVDEFLGGILQKLSGDVTLFVASDHGNIEDVRVGHTRNPALGIVAGQDHARISDGATTLEDVAPMILRVLGVD
jgi:phosphopentomutase